MKYNLKITQNRTNFDSKPPRFWPKPQNLSKPIARLIRLCWQFEVWKPKPSKKAQNLVKSPVLSSFVGCAEVLKKTPVCNTYRGEQSSPSYVFHTYSPPETAESAVTKFSPVKNYFKPFSNVSTEFQLLAIQMIPSSNCGNTKPSGETPQVASALWQPLTSAVFFFNEENIWASKTTGGSLGITPQITSGDCKNTIPTGEYCSALHEGAELARRFLFQKFLTQAIRWVGDLSSLIQVTSGHCVKYRNTQSSLAICKSDGIFSMQKTKELILI